MPIDFHFLLFFREVSGPNLHDLTLIDLPGIYQINSKTQETVEGLEAFLRELYAQFVDKPSCVIVVVMPATDDLGNQLARGWAKAWDLEGKRSIGVVTKVDKGEPQDTYDRLRGVGKNAAKFQLGVVGMLNRAPEGVVGGEELNVAELNFFDNLAKGLQKQKLPADAVGLNSLVKKLVSIQQKSIETKFPKLRLEIEKRKKEVKAELALLPQSCKTPDECQTAALQLFSKIGDTFRSIFVRLLSVNLSLSIISLSFLSCFHFSRKRTTLMLS